MQVTAHDMGYFIGRLVDGHDLRREEPRRQCATSCPAGPRSPRSAVF